VIRVTGANTFHSRPLPSEIEETSALFLFSALMFRAGLALVTFEQVRPLGMMLSDYCFFLSLLLLVPSFRARLQSAKGSGVLLAGICIMSGAVLSLQGGSSLSSAIGPLVRLSVLYGLFAPLALIHCKKIRKNMLAFIGGIGVNSAITVLQASVFPGIVDFLSINPQTPDKADTWRYQGLTEFPVTLGLSASLAVLIGMGMLFSQRRKSVRWSLAFLVLICTIAALLSGSRTFLAALIPGLGVFSLLQEQRRRAALRALVVVVVLGAALVYAAPVALTQYSDRIGSAGLVDYSRLAVAAQAVLEISQRPILGWGVDHLGEAGSLLIPDINEVQGAHVTLLQYWYATGILGAFGIMALFAIPMRRMLRVLKSQPSNIYTNSVRLVLASYVSFFIILNLGPYLYNRYLYIPMFAFAGFAAHLSRLFATEQVPSPLPLS
jgi:O-antigen ligase